MRKHLTIGLKSRTYLSGLFVHSCGCKLLILETIYYFLDGFTFSVYHQNRRRRRGLRVASVGSLSPGQRAAFSEWVGVFWWFVKIGGHSQNGVVVMAVGILRHTLQFVDNLTPEHSEALTNWLAAGDGLLIERDDKRQLITYHLDHPDFSEAEGSEYSLSFARDRITQAVFVVNLMCKDSRGKLYVVRHYAPEDQRSGRLVPESSEEAPVSGSEATT